MPNTGYFFDPLLYFEGEPMLGEDKKAPNSDWAAQHETNPDRHHTEFTTVEHDTPDRHDLANLDPLVCSESEADGKVSDHAGIEGAHHARYTDAEARAAAAIAPLSVGPPAFVPSRETSDWLISGTQLKNYSTLTNQWYYAPVFIPNGATVTKLKLQGYRSSAGSTLLLELQRCDTEQGALTMAALTADWTDGYGSIETSTITYATIDNDSYTYTLRLSVDPDADADDTRFNRVEITWS